MRRMHLCPSFEMFTDGSTKVTLFVTANAGRDSFQRLALRRRLTDGLKSAIMQPCYAPVNYIWFTFVLWLWQAQQGISVSKEVSSSGITFFYTSQKNQETAASRHHQMKTGEIVQTAAQWVVFHGITQSDGMIQYGWLQPTSEKQSRSNVTCSLFP